MSVEFVFIIYSCKKNSHKSEFIYQLLKNKLENTACFIIYGDPTIENEYKIIENKYLVLKCGDFYEHLTQKTIMLNKVVYQLYPNIRGLFKCDDDIIPNSKNIRDMIVYVKRYNPPYFGHLVCSEFHHATHHYGKCSDKKYDVQQKIVHGAKYATGPLYYLNINCIEILAKHPVENEEYFYEDIMVGTILNNQNVWNIKYDSYYDKMSEFYKGCVQNIDNIPKLYIRLHGGLGNQLFQISAGFDLAVKHNKIFIALYSNENYSIYNHHNKNSTEFIHSIFKYINSLVYEDVDLSKVKTYSQKNCFDYTEFCFEEGVDVLLEGYFQNKQYIDIINILPYFQNEVLDKKLLNTYPKLEKSYFIHMRRGDYLCYSTYSIDIDSYYQKAIDYILSIDSGAHFYIFSDDYNFVDNYPLFQSINKTLVYSENTLSEFYMMSLCKLGGICANSTFSGWASQINNNPGKIIIMPKDWIHLDYEYEIPFDYTILL